MARRDDFDDDIDDPSSDAYDYKPVTSEEGASGKAVKMFIALTVIAGMAGGAWYFVGSSSSDGENIPVVRAPDAPLKEKPSEPGGMDVPNRDKTVYNRVSGESAEPKLERLLPRPEAPMEKPTGSIPLPELNETVSEETGQPAITKDLPPAPVEPVEAPVAPVEAPQPDPQALANAEPIAEVPSAELADSIEAPAPPPVADPNAPRALTKRAETPPPPPSFDRDQLAAKIAEALNETPSEETPAAVPTPAPPAPTEVAKAVAPKPKAPQSGFMLQLLSSKSESGVAAAWQKIKKDHAGIVQNTPSNIVRADLGPEKGVYYRLRLGPIASGDRAKSLCNQLKQEKVGCFIVRIQ